MGEEEGGGQRSGPGAAGTILLFHTISARPSKQPRMVGSTLGVYRFGGWFLFLQEQIKDIIIILASYTAACCTLWRSIIFTSGPSCTPPFWMTCSLHPAPWPLFFTTAVTPGPAVINKQRYWYGTVETEFQGRLRFIYDAGPGCGGLGYGCPRRILALAVP